MPETLGQILITTVITCAGSLVVSIIFSWLKDKRQGTKWQAFQDVARRVEILERDCTQNIRTLAALQVQMQPLWNAIEKNIALMLHCPTPDRAILDLLLEKFANDTISVDELKHLKILLSANIKDESDKALKIAAALSLAAVDRKIHRVL